MSRLSTKQRRARRRRRLTRDPVAFIEALGYRLEPWQKDMMRALATWRPGALLWRRSPLPGRAFVS
jgi:hypothetical protein